MASPPAPEREDIAYRVRRGGVGAVGAITRAWRERRWLRWLGYLAAAFVLALTAFMVVLTRNLPSADTLLGYQPPLPTMVRDIDGAVVYSYARERRVQLRFVDFPKPLINAFLAAEDKSFWSHGGVDYTGVAGAVFDYVTKFGSGERARGGSTITQQVAKNILIGNEYSITRKLKEMILARRIEAVLSKQQILELYLNEIPLGRQSFGVQAAAQAYFGKDVDQLSLAQSAFLAILPKAPEKYGRPQFARMAMDRRAYVLDQMVKDGWASPAEAAAAKAEPIALIARRVQTYDAANGYFVEEVRRRLIAKYGENADAGPNSVYAGGLWVRTSLDTGLQRAARDALRAGLVRFNAGTGWRGPAGHLDGFDPERWQTQLLLANRSIVYQDWRLGVVLARGGAGAGTIGFADGATSPLTNVADAVRAGDLVAAAPSGAGYAMKVVPAVSGAILVEAPDSGRVLAMQGGFDPGLGDFNRATQAQRQPGSTIKPFVYATGLDAGMTPATMVLDGTFCVYQGAALGQKCFKNFDNRGVGGTHTMRWGLEQSRNLMTVRIANQAGMDKVTKTFARVGIGQYRKYLSYALGAGETTVGQMVNAYAAIADNGVQYPASVVDYVQDRAGKVIWRADTRTCAGCAMAQWDGKPMPRLEPRGRQVLDPRTAYQVLHMLEGVVIRGTAEVLRDLQLPLFGKTGTTSGPTNVWFVGGSQRVVAGVYLGYDQPRSLGGYAQGGRIAAPVFKQFVEATLPRWSHVPFVAPEGIRLVKIDRVTGKRVFGGVPGDDPKAAVIWEAFKPETEPPRSGQPDDLAHQREELFALLHQSRDLRRAEAAQAVQGLEQKDFAEEQGGVY